MTLSHSRQRICGLIESPESPIGLYRFARKLRGLVPHLASAAEGVTQDDPEEPGERFYRFRDESGGRARDVLFHLEGLARIDRKTQKRDREAFDALRDRFKELEDALGRVDYHDELREIARNLGASGEVVGFFTGAYHADLEDLTRRLLDSGWLENEDDSPALEQTLDTLEGVDWHGADKDHRRILRFLDRTLEKILEKGGACDPGKALDLNRLEEGLHEFRRTVRWFPIYTQALGGFFRLTGTDPLDPSLAEYHPLEITESPYARFPEDEREVNPIDLDASILFAFHFLIDRLGDLKEDGQLAEALALAHEQTGIASGDKLRAHIRTLLGPDRTPSEEIPARTKDLVHRFLHEHRIPQRMRESWTS